MDTSELWRLSKKLYGEIVFQSFFSFRVGGILPQAGDTEKNIVQLVRSAEWNFMLSKVIFAIFISALGVFTFFSGILLEMKELAAICGVSSMLSIVMFMTVFMGLQVVTSFVSSRVAEFLIPLPVSSRDVSKILLMCFIRIFDVPLIAAILIIPMAYGISYRSIPGALIVLLSIVITEIFALSIAVFLAYSFYSKVIKGGGRSSLRTLLRLFYMLVWIIPMFLMFTIMSFAMQIVNLMKNLTQSLSYLLTLLYPFSFGFLASLATFFKIDDPKIAVLSVGSSILYLVLAVYSFKWLFKKVAEIGFGSVSAVSRVEVKEISINPGPPWLGVLKKDLRIASRSPSYFSILIMPIIQIIIFSFSFRSFYSNISSVSMEFLPYMLLPLFMIYLPMVLLLPLMLLNTESIAYSYIGSLPLRKRTMILAKTILSSIVYFASLLIFLVINVPRVPSLMYLFALFGGIFSFSAIASIIFEIILLLRTFGQTIPSGNLYLRLYYYILPWVLSYIIAIIPILIYYIVLFLTASFVLSMTGLAATSILEFLIAVLLLARKE